MPWTMTLLSLLTKMLTGMPPSSAGRRAGPVSIVRSQARSLDGASGQLDGLLGRAEHRRLRDQRRRLVRLQDLPPLLGVGPVQPDHDRRLDVDATEGLDDA